MRLNDLAVMVRSAVVLKAREGVGGERAAVGLDELAAKEAVQPRATRGMSEGAGGRRDIERERERELATRE